MPKTARRKSTPPDPTPEEQRPVGEEETTPEGGEGAESTEGGETNGHGTETEEPAQMEVKMKGTAAGVRTAARRLAGETTRPAPRPDKEPPEDDGTDALLADPKNMIVVARQLPRVFVLRNGEEVRCAVKVEKYTCPITRDEIEEDVFERFGGKKYKATIHPNTTTGENTILGAFTMEHPTEASPYVEDPETPEEAAARVAASIPGSTDPTMRETDNLADMKAALQRRLERAQMMKEIKETERMVREAERELQNDGKPAAPAAPAGPDPRDREIEELRKRLEKKETDDRFAAMQQSIQQTSTQIAKLSESIAALAARPAKEEDPKNSLAMQMLTQSQQHSKDMLDMVKTMNRPVAAPVTTEDQLDKMLDRFNKMKNAFGKDDSRVSEFQDKLLEMAMDRALGGNGDEGEGAEEDTMKFAIKQFTPVLKTYVEKQVEKEEGGKGGGEKVSKERLKEIYAEAASKAAKELEVKWQKEGWIVRDPNAGRNLPAPQKKPGLPAPKNPPPGKVVARTKTAEGIVEHVRVQPADLSQKTTPKGDAATAEAPAPVEKKKEAEEVRYTEMPGIGKIEIPATPGDMKYNREQAVNFVLDSIISEIHEGVPKKASGDPAAESYVPRDALEYLDEELLAEIHRATSGDELKETLGKWGAKAKFDRIEEAGKDKDVDSWLRRVIRTIQDVWRDTQKEKGNG